MKKILAIVLTILMIFGSAADMYAASSNVEYIADICAGYGDTGKQALINAGYTVWENLNANDGGRGDAVWIGYKTTDDATKAITDIALMNMNGGYSYSDWVNEIEIIKDDVANLLKNLGNSIIEYQNNFEAQAPLARIANELLNKFEETDSGEPFGDYLLNVENPLDDEKLKNVFLLANSDLLTYAEEYIALACTDYNDEKTTFLTRLESYHYTGKLNFGNNDKRQTVMDAVEDFATAVEEAEKDIASIQQDYENYVISEAEPKCETLDAYLDTLEDGVAYNYQTEVFLIKTLKETAYADTGHSFYDFVKLDKNSRDGSAFTYCDEIMEPLVNCLTDGQLGTLEMVTLYNLILYASSAYDEEAYSNVSSIGENVEKALTELGLETISLYYGVDRSLYESPSGVALTSDAKRAQVSGQGGYNEAEKEKYDPEDEELYTTMQTAFQIISVSCAVISTAGVALWYYLPEEIYTYSFGKAVNGGQAIETLYLGRRAAVAKVCGWVAAVAFIILIVALVCTLITAILKIKEKQKAPDDITYNEVPRAIVDLRTDQATNTKTYINYYAVKNVLASATETESTNLYADVNAVNGKNQWFVIYYSKDKNAGTPLTTEMVVSSSSEVKSGYMAFHEFGSDAAVDLNKYNSGINRKTVYAYVKQADVDTGLTASVFSTTRMVINGVAGLAVGAVLSGLFVGRKKKKEKTA